MRSAAAGFSRRCLLAAVVAVVAVAALALPSTVSARPLHRTIVRDSTVAAATDLTRQIAVDATLGSPLTWVFGQNNYTLNTPSGVRTFFVYVPSSYDGARNVSLLLCLHGLTDEAVRFATRVRAANMTRKAEERGFLLLYPQGSTGTRGTGWNAGTCCVDGVDDVAFLTSLIGLMRETFLVRTNSIHSFGFSNGGFMSETLACRLGGLLRSISSVSGNTILQPGLDAGLRACDQAYKQVAGAVAILHVHGDADPVVKYDGNPESPNFFPPVPRETAAWAARNGCDPQPRPYWNVSTFASQVWQSCQADGASDKLRVESVVNHGGVHTYPVDPALGLVVSDYILQFIDQVTPGGL